MPDRVKDACEACFAAHSDDCSAFVRAVAQQLGITPNGVANDIVDTIRNGPPWVVLADGIAAAQAAADGKFVLGGLKGSERATPDPHGHVVVVVATAPGQSLAHGKYPFAYWGTLGGVGERDQTINWAWTEQDRDRVTYAAHDISGAAEA
jgi:hypothetical protein